MKQIKNFQQALEYLGNKTERPYAHNTRIEAVRITDSEAAIVAKYHGNIVATFTPDHNVYTSAGWKTLTTKERINWFLPDGFRVYQERSMWHLSKFGVGSWIWQDGITVDSAGNVSNAADETESDEVKKTIKAIKKYVDGFIKALLNGKVEQMSAGDCWYCFMQTESGESLGEATHNTDHILSHLKEPYYVPSLLYRAVEKTGHVSTLGKDGIARLWQGEKISEWQASIVARDVKSCLTSYLKHELGIAQ